jgi:quaternary ammonium compound-resistance protein SugE
MYDAIAIFWIVVGGLLEPLWLIALKRSDNFKDKKYAAIAVFFMVASPFCLSLAMKSMPVGISYAVWTGIGAIGAVGAGALLFKESITPKTLLFVALIIAGAVGLALLEA